MEATKMLMILALAKLRLLSANKGREACPSCEMELANKTEKGTVPVAKRVTKSMWGPDSGMMPTKTASRIIQGILELIHVLMSK